MSARRAVARPADGRDLMDEVLAYEQSSLPEREKVALRLTDAFLSHPASYSARDRMQLLEHFSPEQVVELLLKLAAWTVNKSMTALRLDAAINEGALTTFDYDPNGALVLGLPI
jgi:alkylhydroperoxidase family enzyme